MPKMHNITQAKERELARQRKYHRNDILQPFDDKGRRSSKFERVYGNKLKLHD